MRAPASTAATIVSTASRMSPRANGIVARQRALEEPARLGLVGVAAPDEHRRGHLVDRERGRRAPAQRRASKRSSCQVPVAIGLSRVRRPSDGFLEKSWKNCFNSLPVLRTLRRARDRRRASPPQRPPRRLRRAPIPQGVSISGVRVGGLSAEPARAADRDRVCTADHGSPTRARTSGSAPESLGAGFERQRGRQLGSRGHTAEPYRAARPLLARAGSTARSPRSPSASTGRPSTRRSSARPPPGPSSRRRRPASRSTPGRCAPRSRELLRDGRARR